MAIGAATPMSQAVRLAAKRSMPKSTRAKKNIASGRHSRKSAIESVSAVRGSTCSNMPMAMAKRPLANRPDEEIDPAM